MKKDTFRVALCGVISAFAFMLMLLTNLIPVGTYALPCIAGILLTAVVVEFGWKWALAAFAAVSLLSVFFAGDKEAVAYFIAFFGFYPIAKSGIERIRSLVVQYIIKYALFTVCMVAAFCFTVFVLMIPVEEFKIFGFYVPWAFLIFAEIMFFFYDKCVTILVTRYIISVRGKLFHF